MRNERLLDIAEAIEAHPEAFDMAAFVEVSGKDPRNEAQAIRAWECGTTACVAGWACHLWIDEIETESFDVEMMGQVLLGLTDDEANRLFYENWDSAAEAARGLRDIAFGEEIPDPWASLRNSILTPRTESDNVLVDAGGPS